MRSPGRAEGYYAVRMLGGDVVGAEVERVPV
jgi:hypothetical protein